MSCRPSVGSKGRVSHELHELERMLRAARAAPRAEFVRELERALADREPVRPERRRVRVLVAGSGLVAALAVIVVVLAVAGLLPFGSSGGRAQAGEDCRIMRVERTER